MLIVLVTDSKVNKKKKYYDIVHTLHHSPKFVFNVPIIILLHFKILNQ